MCFVGKTHLQIITSTRYLENTVSEHKHRVDYYFEKSKDHPAFSWTYARMVRRKDVYTRIYYRYQNRTPIGSGL